MQRIDLARFVMELLPRTSRGYHNRFTVPSERIESRSYTVAQRNRNLTWACSCPHWIYRLNPLGLECKHIDATKRFLAARREKRRQLAIVPAVVLYRKAGNKEVRYGLLSND